jgi:hypothetical protein
VRLRARMIFARMTTAADIISADDFMSFAIKINDSFRADQTAQTSGQNFMRRISGGDFPCRKFS